VLTEEAILKEVLTDPVAKGLTGDFYCSVTRLSLISQLEQMAGQAISTVALWLSRGWHKICGDVFWVRRS
jgi:hypothetical protein